MKGLEYGIDLLSGSKSMREHPFLMGLGKREVECKEKVNPIENDEIFPSQLEWCAPIVSARKKYGTLRFLEYYRRLKAMTVPNTYSIPRMNECLYSLGNAAVF